MAHISHFHTSTSASNNDNVEKFDAEILDDVMDAVHHDTEVVHFPDSAENSDTDMLYAYDTEVVPDSEDEAAYTNDSERHSRRRGSFIESLAADLYKVESQSNPLHKKLDWSNLNGDTCGDERHDSDLASDMIVCQESEGSPVNCHGDGKMSVVKDPRIIDSVSCDANSVDDIKRSNMNSTVEKNGKVSQSKTRDIHIVYTRKTNRLCTPDTTGPTDVNRPTNESNECGGLSYVESQEPEDVSTALHFVDKYLSVGAVPTSSSPMVSVKTKQNSPPALSATGVQKLVRWTVASKSENQSGIFEWDDSIDGVGGCIPLKNKRAKKFSHTYVRRSPSVNNSVLTEQVHKNEVREDSKEEHQMTAEEPMLTKTEINAISEDSEHVFDIGIGTQIAAEAIQALSSIVSAEYSEMNVDQRPQKVAENSGDQIMHAGFWSFPKKTRSPYRGTPRPDNHRINCSVHVDDMMQPSRQSARRNNRKSAAAECVVENSAGYGNVNMTKNPKAYRSKDVYSCKENLHVALSVGDMALPKQKRGRKVKNVNSAASLKSSTLFNMNEGRVKKFGRYNKRKESGEVGDTVNVSNEKADHSKEFSDISLNTMKTTLHDDDKKHLVLDGDAADILVEADACADALNPTVASECNLVQLTKQLLGNYPRGKRARRPTVGHFQVYSDLENPFVKGSHDEDNHRPMRCQSNAESCSASSASQFVFKRKRRSTTYISPCFLSSTKSEKFLNKNVSVYDGDFAEKDNTLLEQVIKCTVTPQVSAVDVTGCKAGDKMKKVSPTALTRELFRLGFDESMPEFTPKTSRQRKTMANIRVLLSHSLDKRTQKNQTKILARFGVPIASCPSIATHFVTDRFARTRNMLVFIAQGKPVVTHRWLESCDQAGFYIDDRDYIVRDFKKERELGFKLPISLDRARHHPLLRGYKVFITPNAKPGKEVLASLVNAVQGEVVNVVTDSKLDNLLILSCDEDQTYCVPFLQSGTAVYSSELLLNGIIIQKLEFARHRLFVDNVKE